LRSERLETTGGHSDRQPPPAGAVCTCKPGRLHVLAACGWPDARSARLGQAPRVQVAEVVRRMGGVADARTLIASTSRRKVRTALRRGLIVRDGKGRYALPTAQAAVRAAARLNGVISGKSAAAYYGWAMKTPPEQPTITVPRNRRVAPQRRAGVDLKWRDIPPEHVTERGVTSPAWTVIDCAKTLPFDEALSIADSALRDRDVTKAELLRLAQQIVSTGRTECLRVVQEADGRAANPFESVLRSIAKAVPGLDVKPQVWIGNLGRVDLADKRLRLVIEAESFEFHGKRWLLKRDCERYNSFGLLGWWVIRFAWEHVMLEPEYVRAVLTTMVRVLTGLPVPEPPAQRKSA